MRDYFHIVKKGAYVSYSEKDTKLATPHRGLAYVGTRHRGLAYVGTWAAAADFQLLAIPLVWLVRQR